MNAPIAGPAFCLGATALTLLAERRMVVSVATRDAGLRPHLGLGLAYRVLDEGRRIEVLLDAARHAAVVADLRANGEIAAVFSEPSTHRTLQVKGSSAVVRDGTPDDQALAAASRAAFIDEVQPLGLSADYARTLMQAGPALVVTSFVPREAWEQTPGAQAGTPLAAP